MNTPNYPGRQHMRSFVWRNPEEVYSNFAYCRKVMGATQDDVTINHMEQELVPLNGAMVPSVRYTVEWKTYKGWRVYMLLAGALTPKQEPNAGRN